MSDPQEQSLNAFIAYKAVNGKLRPVQLVAAPSKAQALKLTASLGLVELVAVEDVEDAGDVVKLTLPAVVLMLGQLSGMLAVMAQNAQEAIQERAKRRLGLVGN
jgi:hypothetical protein